MNKIYLCSRYDRQPEMARLAADLEYNNYKVTSRWVRLEHDMSNVDDAGKDRYASEDLSDLRDADTVIAFTELPSIGYTAGGRHVEFGAALAWYKSIILVGPRENVFYYLEPVEHIDTLEHLYLYLELAPIGS